MKYFAANIIKFDFLKFTPQTIQKSKHQRPIKTQILKCNDLLFTRAGKGKTVSAIQYRDYRHIKIQHNK